MRLLVTLLLTAALLLPLNFSTEAFCAQGRNSSARGSGQCLQKNQSSNQAVRQNQKGAGNGSGSADRKRLRDGSCVNPVSSGK
jgi:hypothetical protein